MTVIMTEPIHLSEAKTVAETSRSFDQLLWGVALLDAERRLHYYNPEFTSFLCAQTGLQLTEKDLLGHTLPLDSLWDAEPEPPKSRWQLLTPNGKFTIVAERLNGDSHLRQLHPELNYMLQLHPNSATQQIPGELASAITVGHSSNKEKLELLTSFSHEFRTPLNAVLGFGNLLLEEVESKTQKQHVESILTAGTHLLKLVNEILTLSKADYDGSELNMQTENVDVQRVVSECVSLLQPIAEQSGITIEQSGDACFLICDRTRLRQIILNLLTNAIRYNKPHGTVVIKSLAVGNRCSGIEVQDTGDGIPPALADTIFNPFKRLLLQSGKREGSGIGLMLTRRLINMMGGRIRVSSRLGQGSVFAVDFNLDDDLAGTAGLSTREVLWIGRDCEARRFASSLVNLRSALRLRCADQVPALPLKEQLPDLIIVDGELSAALDAEQSTALQALLRKSSALGISDPAQQILEIKLSELGILNQLPRNFSPVELMAELDRVVIL